MNVLMLKLRATECNGWPKIKIFIDNDIIEEYEFNNKDASIIIPIDLLDGQYTLNIELFNKNKHNCIIDNNGKIIQDQTVELVDIYIDNIRLPNFYKWMGIYKFGDQTLLQAVKWGYNGVWSWTFEVPIITWILNKKIEDQEKNNKPKVSYFEIIKKDEELLDLMDSNIKCIKE